VTIKVTFLCIFINECKSSLQTQIRPKQLKALITTTYDQPLKTLRKILLTFAESIFTTLLKKLATILMQDKNIAQKYLANLCYQWRVIMNKVKSTALATIATTTLMLGASFNASAMDKNIETALIDVCKSALSDSSYKLKKTTKSYNLSNKKVALNVMCNGEDIISFAENHGAHETAATLERSIGGVSITDVAKAKKTNVEFDL